MNSWRRCARSGSIRRRPLAETAAIHDRVYPARMLLLTFFPALLLALPPALVSGLLPRLRVGIVASPLLVSTFAVLLLLLLLLVVLAIGADLRRRFSRSGPSARIPPTTTCSWKPANSFAAAFSRHPRARWELPLLLLWRWSSGSSGVGSGEGGASGGGLGSNGAHVGRGKEIV